MARKLIAFALCWVLLVSNPLSVLAQQDLWNGYENLPASGMGFFPAFTPAGDPAYLLRTSQGVLWASPDALWFVRWEDQPLRLKHEKPPVGVRGVNLKFTFPGAARPGHLQAEQPMPGQVSFLKGTGEGEWQRNLVPYGLLRYNDLYPGVDLVLQSTPGGFRWEYEIRPGTSTSQLHLQIQGAKAIQQEAGLIHIQTQVGPLNLPGLGLEGGTLVEESARQQSATTQQDRLDLYPTLAPSAPVPPKGAERLQFSTFLGGSQMDSIQDVAVDAAGYAYMVGSTPSPNFPVTPGAFDTTFIQTDGFAAKIDPQGPTLLYATYLGGDGTENASSLAILNGVAYISGETDSPNFPLAGSATQLDAFLVALNATGNNLNYSRLLGGSDDDQGYGLAVENGSAYLTGVTYSADFPITTSSSYKNNGDVFVVKLNSNGSTAYSTLLGGSNVEAGYGLAVRSGAAWLTGETSSNNMAGTLFGITDVFVAKLNTNGETSSIRLFGGRDDDRGFDLALDDAGDIYITGFTASNNFPATEGSYSGYYDAILLKVNETSRLYSAYLGGDSVDQGLGIDIDANGGIVVTGLTQSTNFPVTSDAFQLTTGGESDAFVTRYFLAGSDPGHRTFSTYLGGTGADKASAVAMDATINAYLGGETRSSNFPVTTNALYPILNGAQDGFLAVMAVAPVPTVQLTKFTNGQDANAEPGPLVRVGQPVSWSYVVNNTGEVTLSNIHVTDNMGLLVTCPNASLAAGASMTCTTANGTATAGQYSNLGTVSATTPYSTTVYDVDASHYFGSSPATTVIKRTNTLDAQTLNGVTGAYIPVGTPVTWTYEVTNTGNVPLSGVAVLDDKGVTVTCPKNTLAVGETMTCSANGTATTGQYINIGSVSATPPDGAGNVTAQEADGYFGSAPAITLTKKTNGVDTAASTDLYLLAGTGVTWTYDVKNTGNVPLTGISLVDNPAGTVTCPATTLASGAQMQCSKTGTATPGAYQNTATLTALPPVGASLNVSDSSYYFGAQPAISLEYSVNSNDADTLPGLYVLTGSSLVLRYQVSNTGNVPLTNIRITEGAATHCTIPSLAVGASDSSCTRTIPAEAGQQSSSATATAKPPSTLTDISTSDPMYYFGANPNLTFSKLTNGQDVSTSPGVYVLSGSTVTWTYQLQNSGNVTLSGVSLVDDNGTPANPADDLRPAACTNISLTPGQSVSCTASASAQANQYNNNAVVNANPPAPLSPIQRTDSSYYFGVTLDLNLDKRTNDQDPISPTGLLVASGSPVHWDYQVSNTSNVAVNISIKDDNGTPGTPGDDITFCSGSLGTGASQTCTLNGTAGTGAYTNIAVLTATPPGGLSSITRQDTSHYFGVVTGINLVKLTNGQDANSTPGPYIKVGDPVTWSFSVTNTSNVQLTGVSVTDDKLGAITCPKSTLAAGETMNCNASGTAAAGQYENLGSVTANPPAGFNPVSDSDPSHYYGSSAGVDLQKLTNGQDVTDQHGPFIRVGTTVTWSFIVTNTGNMPLTNILVQDDHLGAITNCTGPLPLQPTQSRTCTASAAATAGQYTNIGSVMADVVGLSGAFVVDQDTSYYFGADPSISILKKTNGTNAQAGTENLVKAGSPVSWTYEIQNTGDYPLSEVMVSDSDPEIEVSCPKTTLEPSESMTCTTPSQTAEAGSYQNLGSVSAQASAGQPPVELGQVEASEADGYFGYTLGLSLSKFTNGQDISSAPGPELFAGHPVTWRYQVENQGNIALAGVEISDDMEGWICTIPSLAPAQTLFCEKTGIVQLDTYQNTGTAAVNFIGEDLSAADSSWYVGVVGRSVFLPLIIR